MTPQSIASVTAIISAIITALGLAWVTKRQRSGRIGTTEASRLWDASERMRAEKDADVAALKVEIAHLRADHDACTAKLNHFAYLLAQHRIGDDNA